LKGAIKVEVNLLLAVAIFLPALAAILCYLVRNSAFRSFTIVISAIALALTALGFADIIGKHDGKIEIYMENMPFDIGLLIGFLDFVLLAYIVYTGVKLKKPLVVVLAVLQAVPLFIFEIMHKSEEQFPVFVIDYLSLIMLFLVSVIGPIILVFAMGYMKNHESHMHLKTSKQPRFFMILFVFLASMNALVTVNNLLWMYFFWEITTLCSFLLISHDKNAEAVKNATRALWINLLGGIAFVAAIIIISNAAGTLSIQDISSPNAGLFSTELLLGLALLCFAGFTKSAQFPFQSWLLGAMVAPTPVSALLHSSTMVKAGVYLIVRTAPAFYGTTLGNVVAMVGGFTFVAAAAIAISQSNGKRVLAYSTISNLGLIICCAGIGSQIALGAAMLLIIFHAISKGLLFLCIGTIEQGIGSRDIEDMQGLMKLMPFTTIITVIGMISMLLPPFGVLITKWLALEASVGQPVVLIMIVFGSAFTVVFWSKWIGIILTMSYKPKYIVEKLSVSIRISLILLLAGVLAASLLIGPLFKNTIEHQLDSYWFMDESILTADRGGVWIHDIYNNTIGGVESILFFLIILAIMIMIPYLIHKTKPANVKPPYLCGSNTDDPRGIEFISPKDKIDSVVVHNYYMKGFFGEKNLTLITNLIATAFILIMFGVVTL